MEKTKQKQSSEPLTEKRYSKRQKSAQQQPVYKRKSLVVPVVDYEFDSSWGSNSDVESLGSQELPQAYETEIRLNLQAAHGDDGLLMAY